MLGINPEPGRPEHQEHRWVPQGQADALLNARLRSRARLGEGARRGMSALVTCPDHFANDETAGPPSGPFSWKSSDRFRHIASCRYNGRAKRTLLRDRRLGLSGPFLGSALPPNKGHLLHCCFPLDAVPAGPDTRVDSIIPRGGTQMPPCTEPTTPRSETSPEGWSPRAFLARKDGGSYQMLDYKTPRLPRPTQQCEN